MCTEGVFGARIIISISSISISSISISISINVSISISIKCKWECYVALPSFPPPLLPFSPFLLLPFSPLLIENGLAQVIFNYRWVPFQINMIFTMFR